MKVIYFPELDGLRFLAFFLVLFSHMPTTSGMFWAGSWVDIIISRTNDFGWIGVDIFLVLSSYLITSLLLAENDKSGSINIKSFYIRRAIRIWPVYYPYLLFAIFVYSPFRGFPSDSIISHHLLPFMVFSGNFSYWYFMGYVNYSLAHLWTISLEEQFYLVAPVLIAAMCKWKPRSIIILALCLEALTLMFRYYVISNGITYPMVWVGTPCRLDPLIIGAITAVVVRQGWKIPGLVLIFGSAALYAVVMSFSRIGTSPDIIWQLLGVDLAAALLILGSLYSKAGRVIFANRPMRFLGKISFGLYIYHEIGLREVQRATAKWLVESKPEFLVGHETRIWIFVFSIALLLTIMASTMSYFAWERPFLRLKSRFEIIKSRPISGALETYLAPAPENYA